MLIKLGDMWVDPSKVMAVKAFHVMDDSYSIQVFLIGMNYSIDVREGLDRDNALDLCDTYANEIMGSLVSFGNGDE